MISSRMTPKQRDELLQSGGTPDRIPAIPFMGEIKCEVSGVSAEEFWEEEEAMVRTEIESYRRFQYDRIVIGPNTNGFSEALGMKLLYKGQEPPKKTGIVIRSEEDAENLPSPEEITGRCSRFISAAEKLLKEAGDEVPIEMSIGGPLTIISGLRGIELLLIDSRKNPELVHLLMRKIVEIQKEFVRETADLGAGYAMADPVASPVLIGPRVYKEFVYPYTLELTRFIKEQCGRGVSLHMCGKTYSIWKFIREYSLQEISLDNIIDLHRAAEELGDAVPIAGNVNPVDIMHYGSPDDVKTAVKSCIEAGKHAKKGFHLATGCDIAPGTPWENIDAFMEAVEEFGRLK